MSDDKKLADDHVEWLIDLIRFIFDIWVNLTQKLMREEFIHGYKHGREDERKNWLRAKKEPVDKPGSK